MRCLNALLMALWFVSIPMAVSGSDIQLPENASLAWVSENINQDGMQLSIQEFYSKESIESVLAFYREYWFKDSDIPGFVENTMGEWSVISQLRDDENVVLQLKMDLDGGTQGFLSIARKYSNFKLPNINFPIPDGTDRFSTSYVEEDEAHVYTMTFISSQSVGNAVSFYRNNMPAKNWAIAKDKDVEGNHVMLFNRNGDRCEMVVSQLDSESTVIHVNLVERNG